MEVILTYSMFLKWIFIISSVLLDKTYASPGKEFPGDKLIGRETLIDNANQWIRNDPDYRTTLLVVEGNFDNYNLGNGFFMGYQFYDQFYAQENKINLQLYRLSNLTSSDPYVGNYILVDESGWITTQAGLNVYYHKHSIIIDTSDSTSDSYIIGFTVPKNVGDVPVLFTECTGNSMPALVSSSSTEPVVGESSLFQRDVNQNCISYSIQGIFLSTNLASASGGSCTLSIAQPDDPTDVTSHTPFESNKFQRGSNTIVCRLVRAEYEDYTITVNTKTFELPTASDCSNTQTAFVEIGDQKQPSNTDMNVWGRYCGETIFSSRETNEAYVKIIMDTGTSSALFTGFKFSVESKEKDSSSNIGMWIGIGIAAFVVVFVVILAVCITSNNMKKKAKKRQVLPTNQNPRAQIRSNINDSSKIRTYPKQPGGRPKNSSLPPLNHQPVNSYSQQNDGLYIDSNQERTGGLGMLYLGGAGLAATTAMRQQQQPEQPPQYSTIYPNQPPEYDQYGVPMPAVYKDP